MYLLYNHNYAHFDPKGYAYYIINPWRVRHDEVIRRILEAGLIEQWKRRAWIRMKEEHQNELRIKGEEGIKFDIKPLISEMTMNDFQVNFFNNSKDNKIRNFSIEF